jgi:hypothetical protein
VELIEIPQETGPLKIAPDFLPVDGGYAQLEVDIGEVHSK